MYILFNRIWDDKWTTYNDWDELIMKQWTHNNSILKRNVIFTPSKNEVDLIFTSIRCLKVQSQVYIHKLVVKYEIAIYSINWKNDGEVKTIKLLFWETKIIDPINYSINEFLNLYIRRTLQNKKKKNNFKSKSVKEIYWWQIM